MRGRFGILRGRRGKTVGLVKTRRLAAMHPPSPRLRRTGKQQRAKAGMKPPVNGGAGKGNVSSLMHAHLKSKMQNRWAIVIDVWDVGLI